MVFNTVRIANFSTGELPVKGISKEKGKAIHQIRILYRELKEAVMKEDYLAAAKARDTIRLQAQKLGQK